ncbi:thiopeptide-type bacteriocin biosynthesis protein [Actinocorallia populi]|uniref:thiopeptide-type bacteriocin biosynthesis protein n=1 Tax=Actinocorallia populi TaxID=2079200 RepID=UPI000D088975|nr:thiopeptide-type bacteriocin biosynthesis protein [Actinocorallia populi]
MESLPVSRKKVLLRLLARREAQRFGITPTLEETQATLDGFREAFGLLGAVEMSDWLESQRLTAESLKHAMYDFTLIRRLEELHSQEIDREVADHIKVNSARERLTNGRSSGSRESRWLQVNVGLSRDGRTAGESARQLFARLSPALAEWREIGALELFFFMRKPPDVRLRFFGCAVESAVLPALAELLSKLAEEGFVTRFFESVYEPEVSLFGGRAAMSQVHAHFDADTTTWTAFDQLVPEGVQSLSAETFMTAALNDLFLRTLSCSAEVWDVWCGLAELYPVTDLNSAIEGPTAQPILIDSFLPRASARESTILRDRMRTNQELADGLREVWNRGELHGGLRSLLRTIAVFDLNRHGLSGGLPTMADSMRQGWDPRRPVDRADDGKCPHLLCVPIGSAW